MHAGIKLASIFLLTMVTLSLFVYAAGESTAGLRSSTKASTTLDLDSVRVNASADADVEADASTSTEEESTTRIVVDTKEAIRLNTICEQKSSRKARIECRLQLQRNISLEGLNVTEESCRSVKNKSRCSLLYAQVHACYDMDGRQKDQCFKRVAGFAQNRISEEKSPDAVRTYMVFLLYNLQEKVEVKSEAELITSAEAAVLIDLIVDIKQKIMNGASRTEIKTKLGELRTEWQTIME